MPSELPKTVDSVEQLNELLSRPTDGVRLLEKRGGKSGEWRA